MTVLVIQNCEAEGIGLYQEHLQAIGISLTTVHAYREAAFPPMEGIDAIIIGGTPISAYHYREHQFLAKERAFLEAAQRLGVPALGVCFGGQFLALQNAAAVKRNPVMEIGGYEVSLTEAGQKDPLFAGFPGTFPVFHWHGDTFDVPRAGALLAEGRDCRNQAFVCGASRGLQFHLELTATDAARWADAYADELARFGKTKEQVVSECAVREMEMARLAGLLIRNFAHIVGPVPLE